MRFCVLGSGSKGNSTYVSAGDTAILIDAGFSGIEVARRLALIGVDISSLSAILITHEHGDHIRGVSILSRRHNLTVFANKATISKAGKPLDNLFSFQEFSTGKSFQINNLKIHPFSVSHDAADPVGFTISNGKSSIGYCTDTGMVSRLIRHRLTGLNALVLECNHDPEILKTGPYPLSLQQRVSSKTGHLANSDAAVFLADIFHDKLEHVVLAHISETNNLPEIIRETMTSVLNKRHGHSFHFNGEHSDLSTCISLARQDRPGQLVKMK